MRRGPRAPEAVSETVARHQMAVAASYLEASVDGREAAGARLLRTAARSPTDKAATRELRRLINGQHPDTVQAIRNVCPGLC